MLLKIVSLLVAILLWYHYCGVLIKQLDYETEFCMKCSQINYRSKKTRASNKIVLIDT